MNIETIQSLNIPDVRDITIIMSNIGPVVKISFFKEASVEKAVDFFFNLFGEEKNPILHYNKNVLELDLNSLRS